MIVFAVAIKLDSRGPVFFRQLRVGRHGQRFHMLKFRTMVRDADAMKDSLRDRNEAQEGLFKIAEDPRVTRVGKLLRTTALDELPQLLNIVRGEMSLVGPRPLVIEEDERIEGWHRRRLELMPGMTGPWQILGPARVPLKEMVAIDYLYVANWSLWTDVKILLRTVPHVVRTSRAVGLWLSQSRSSARVRVRSTYGRAGPAESTTCSAESTTCSSAVEIFSHTTGGANSRSASALAMDRVPAGFFVSLSSIVVIAVAIAPMSPGANSATTERSTSSIAPTSVVATTGTPAARASATVRANGSYLLACTRMSLRASSSGIWDAGTPPAYSAFSDGRSSSTFL